MIVKYEPAVFNSLMHFNQAKMLVGDLTESISKLGEVIKKFNLNFAGVALLHKHFDITEDEVLVENEADSTSEVYPKPVADYEEGSLTPYMWKVTETGKLAPLEFTSSKDQKISTRIEEVCSSVQFLKEFSALVKELQVIHFFSN